MTTYDPSSVAGLPRTHAAWRDRVESARQGLERCSRFLRCAAAHRARPDDIYVSSYPRSGTTWLSLILHLLRGGDLGFEHLSQVVPWYERDYALKRSRPADFERLPSPRVFKSHLPYAWLPRGGRVIYIMRDGRDVAVSYYHLYRSHLGYTQTFEQFFERFLRGDLQYRSWFRHVADFKQACAHKRALLLHYEQMQRDPRRALRQLAAYCNFTLDSARESYILEATSFAAMRRIEARLDHETGELLALGGRAALRQAQPRGDFVRAGRVGDFQNLLTPVQQRRFQQTAQHSHRSLLRELHLAAFLH